MVRWRVVYVEHDDCRLCQWYARLAIYRANEAGDGHHGAKAARRRWWHRQ